MTYHPLASSAEVEAGSLGYAVVPPSLVRYHRAAQVREVDGGGRKQYSTIADALAAASAGDTVRVHAGTYNLTTGLGWTLAGITLQAVGRVVLNWSGGTSGTLLSYSGANTTIDGFTFTSGQTDTLHIYAQGGGRICNCAFESGGTAASLGPGAALVFENNRISGAWQYFVYGSGSSPLHLLNNVIDPGATFSQYAFYFLASGRVWLADTQVRFTTAQPFLLTGGQNSNHTLYLHRVHALNVSSGLTSSSGDAYSYVECYDCQIESTGSALNFQNSNNRFKARKCNFVGTKAFAGSMTVEIDNKNVLEVGPNGGLCYPTITSAFARAQDGDVVVINPGTYSTAETFPLVQPAGTTVLCPGGPLRTLVDGSSQISSGPIWQFNGECVVRGIALIATYADYGFAVGTSCSEAWFEDCYVRNVKGSGGLSTGYGWYLNGTTGGQFVFRNCGLHGDVSRGISWTNGQWGELLVDGWTYPRGSYWLENIVVGWDFYLDSDSVNVTIRGVNLGYSTTTHTNFAYLHGLASHIVRDCYVRSVSSTSLDLSGSENYVWDCNLSSTHINLAASSACYVTGGNTRPASCTVASGSFLTVNRYVTDDTSAGSSSSTDGVNWTQKLRVTLPTSMPSSNLRITWYCELYSSSTAKQVEVRVQQADTTTIGRHVTLVSQATGWSGFCIVSASGGETFDLDFKCVDTPATAYIQNARILVTREK